jgi:hypothetical protein
MSIARAFRIQAVLHALDFSAAYVRRHYARKHLRYPLGICLRIIVEVGNNGDKKSVLVSLLDELTGGYPPAEYIRLYIPSKRTNPSNTGRGFGFPLRRGCGGAELRVPRVHARRTSVPTFVCP